jgi:hypothetical protein
MNAPAKDPRFVSAALSLNLGGATRLPSGADDPECNPGGSYICTTGTEGCDAGLTCVGTSTAQRCAGGSEDIFERGLDAVILVERQALKELHEELQRVVAKYAATR